MSLEFKLIHNDTPINKLLYDNFMPSYRNGYIEVGDEKYCLPVDYLTVYDSIEKLEVREDDIIIASHPKTGTTWTQEMVWMIMNNLDYEGGKTVLAERFPFLEVTALFNFTTLMKEVKEFEPPEVLTDSVGLVSRMKSPRFIKTHLPYSLLPKQLRDGTKTPKMIYVCRNPKDTCISYYHHCRLIEGYTGNFEDFCKLFLGGRVSYAPYIPHILSYWEKRNNKNILFLKFEELKKDLPAAIRKVSKFLEKELTDGQIKELEKHLSFESMKENRAVNYEAVVELNRAFKLTDHDGTFMRSGAVGNYKAVMTPELIEEFDTWTNEHLKESDFTFDI